MTQDFEISFFYLINKLKIINQEVRSEKINTHSDSPYFKLDIVRSTICRLAIREIRSSENSELSTRAAKSYRIVLLFQFLHCM